MKVSQKKTSTRKKSNNSKRKTMTDCESAASGARHHKIWRPGEKKQTTTDVDDKLQNKVWDPGRQGLKAHDQEIMIIFNLRSLMQGNQGQGNIL